MKKSTLVACVMIASFLLPGFAKAEDTDTLRKQVQQILQQNPQILMDVLRENSEQLYQLVKEGAGKQRRKAMVAQWARDIEQPKKVALDNRIVRGPEEAPVTVVAFSDFTCPYCEQMAFTLNSLLKHYKGTVNLVFKNFPLESHANSMIASQYFVAAGMQNAEKAWAFYDAVFVDRNMLIEQGEPFLQAVAKDVGLDVKRLEKDAKSEKVLKLIAEDQKDAENLGVTGTPYFLVNNIVVRGAIPFDLFTEAVEMALEAENNK